MNDKTLISAFDKISNWWSLNILYDPAHDFTMAATFMEAYCILGGLKRLEYLGNPDGSDQEPELVSDRNDPDESEFQDAMVRQDLKSGTGEVDEAVRIRASVAAFCDRVQSTQGVQGYPSALLMRYGLEWRDGVIKHSCVADQASVANPVLDVIAALPNHPHKMGWLETITTWADWVLDEFPGPDGGMGVGVLDHKWNPMKEYWCATSLFSASLFRLYQFTGNDRYLNQAMDSLGWLSRFDFKNAVIPDFKTSPGGVMLYVNEGLTEGLCFLAEQEGLEAARVHPAADKAREALAWLVENQQENGTLPTPGVRGHRPYEVGIPWLVLRLHDILGPDPDWIYFVEKFLHNLVSESGIQYYGLYNRPWPTGLAQLSLGEWCRYRQSR